MERQTGIAQMIEHGMTNVFCDIGREEETLK